MAQKPRISFVILTWNSVDVIEDCLKSIAMMRNIDSSVCVVDNGSTDKTPCIVEKVGKSLHSDNFSLEIIKLGKNYGTTVSRNIGIRHEHDKSEYLCILDSDTVVNKDAFLEMIKLIEENPKYGIIGPVLKGIGGAVQNSGRAIPTLTVKFLKVMPISCLRAKGEQMEHISDNGEIVKVGYLMSACWFMRMSIVDEIGFLDENIFYAPEDIEYCLRTWTHGYSVLLDRRASITHIWQRLSRKKLISRHNYEHIKGLFYLFWKYKFIFSNKKFNKYIKEQ